MDTRGWVKLARGYGYIRLENDKQLVKVGGTNDKACQIEAILHELSIERNRLKCEQAILKHRSAGLMIDLESSLLTSNDDQVIVPAPEGSLRCSDSKSNLSVVGGSKQLDTSDFRTNTDGIDISNSSRTSLKPRYTNGDRRSPTKPLDRTHGQIRTSLSHSFTQPFDRTHGEIRTNLSHSPNREPNAPDSPFHNQITGNSPMRVNFRTGMSGHRALTRRVGGPRRGDGVASRSGRW